MNAISARLRGIGARAVAAGLALFSALAHGAPDTTNAGLVRSVPHRDERFEARLQGGAVYRNGGQVTPDVDLTYSGVVPLDVSASGWAWLLLDERLGLMARFGRESFGLYDGKQRLVQGGLLRAEVGPSFRYRIGRFRLEPTLAYSLEQVAAYRQGTALAATPTTRHALLLAARGSVDVGPVAIEVRGGYPVTLAARGASNLSVDRVSGFEAGGGVRFPVWKSGRLRLGGIAEVIYSESTVRQDGVPVAAQSLVRGGLAVDVKWQKEDAPLTGSLRLRVVDAETQGALPKATVTVESKAGSIPVALDAAGVGLLADLAPGAVVAKATYSEEPYEAAEATTQIAGGVTGELILALKKVTTGVLAVRVTSKDDGAPIPNASVVVGPARAVTDGSGRARIEGVSAGPVSIEVEAESFLPQTESAVVVAGLTADVTAQMLPASKRVPATLSGRVRSARTGAPTAAVLNIPRLSLNAKVDPKGSFSLQIPGGTYTVIISAPGHVSQTKSVTVRDAEQAIFNVDLVAE